MTCSSLHPCEEAMRLWEKVADAHKEWTRRVRAGARGSHRFSVKTSRDAFDAAYAAYQAHLEAHKEAASEVTLL